ncbi:MAG TPA: cytochrome o ubiquinol oxidase subunit IV [Candidatus Saccharimonadales bacterium]|nr:cytochrome o ubiquinol oxidase subunit IV [Candidatus Saccharimonadales bacterium]
MNEKPAASNDNFGSIWSYVIGFGLSLALTGLAYLSVRHHLATHHTFPTDTAMLVILSTLAISQLIVQLVFFLHLDKESKPRWNLMVLGFAVMVVVIIVAGSLWIMYHLNYNMTPQQMNNYLQQQDGGI